MQNVLIQQAPPGEAPLRGFFRVDRNGTNQTGATQYATNVIQFNNEVSDTDGWYDTSTYKFTPLVSGYYLLLLSVYAALGTGGESGEAYIRKNGATVGKSLYQGSGTLDTALTATALVHLNGSTDYIDFAMYLPDVTTISGAVSNTWATGVRLGG